MPTINIKQPLPTQDKFGGTILPVGTQITLTEEWRTVPYGVQCRVIRVGDLEYGVFDDDLASAQRD